MPAGSIVCHWIDYLQVKSKGLHLRTTNEHRFYNLKYFYVELTQ